MPTKHTILFALLPLVVVALLTACQPSQPHYNVGVSQCLDDAWRRKMNSEMNRELLFHPELTLTTRTADGNNELQCAQIDSFIAERVDLLIVSPNEAEAVKPAVTRAYRAGIPVIVADRRVTGDEWTAFIGGDNYRVGELIGSWLTSKAAREKRTIHVLEIVGLEGSTPAVYRHQGLLDVIRDNPAITLDAIASGIWFTEPAQRATDSLLRQYPNTDVIVAQNDLMAIGAAAAAKKLGSKAKILGVDGLSHGLEAVESGLLETTATYSSRGDMVIQTAADILAGRPFVRDTVLETSLIDRDAARALLINEREHAHDIETIQFMQGQIQSFWSQYEQRTVLLYWALGFILLIFGAIVMYVGYLQIRLSREVNAETISYQTPVTEIEPVQENAFAQRLRTIINDHLSDPDLGIELLASELCMSRAQLFRKTKAATGKAAVELIRELRLARAQELLRTTDMSIQQIAYEVGFTSPSYFTKCYKDLYGENPRKR